MKQNEKNEQFLPIGIDLGSDSVKVAQLSIANSNTQLIAAGSARMSGSNGSNLDLVLAEFTKSLKRIIKEGSFHGKRAVLSIPAEWTFVHHVKVPKGGPEVLDSAVKAEVQGKLPYPIEKAILRYVVAGEVYDDGNSSQEVIAISAKQTVLEAYAKAAHKAGLEVVGINIEPCAIVECFAHLFKREADSSRTILYIDLGTKTTQAVFSRGSKMVFARNIMMAGDSMTKSAAKALGVTSAEVHALRKDILEEKDYENKAEELYGSFTESVNELGDELLQCMRYYESVFPGFTVERAIFVGGQAFDRRLCQLVARRLNLPAQIGDPLVKIQQLGGVLETNHPMPNWAVAIGLSLGAENAA